jgi:hypothetical protein
VVTTNDPSNCGACGIRCAPDQVCTRASCLPPSSCLGGTIACEGRCINPRTDNLHCGGCPGVACPPGKGCSAGVCVDVVGTDGGSMACTGGGPPVMVSSDAGVYCTGNIAQVTFRWAVCACSDVNISTGNFRTDAFDSNNRTLDGGLGASVGANVRITAPNSGGNFDIAGVLWSGGDAGVANDSNGSTVRQDLWSNGPATGSGSGFAILGDAHINGNVSPMSIRGTLYVPVGAVVAPSVTYGAINRGPVSVGLPCDCSPNQLVDTAGIVRNGATNNDNAAIGLDPSVFQNSTTPKRLDLPCGRYYLTSITPGALGTIVVHGRAALFVAGSLDTSRAAFEIAIDPQAELDIFIGGTIVNGTGLRLGNYEVPAQLRIYIAGSPVDMSAQSNTAGNYYLARSRFDSPSNLDLYGSIFADSFSGQGAIHYDRAVLNAGYACGGPPPPDGGIPPTSCTSCRDCVNQACVAGTCGACTTSADCCAPLQCIGGACTVRIN